MLIIEGDRRSGKTAALVGAFLADKDQTATIVFPNEQCRQIAFRTWPQLRNRSSLIAESLLNFGSDNDTDLRLYVDDYRSFLDHPAWVSRLIVALTRTLEREAAPVGAVAEMVEQH